VKLFKLWRSRKRLIGLAYLVIGLLVANAHHYFAHIQTVKGAVSAVLAVGLWPLVLLEVNVHIH
jgi:hypothetical protein